MHNDGENFTLNSLCNEISTTKVQSATDCFRLGRTISQFRRFCLPSTQSYSSVEDYEPIYSWVNSRNTNEESASLELPEDPDTVIDDDEDNLISEININSDNYRLCKTKAAHDHVFGKIDSSLVRKTLTAIEAPHLDNKSLIAKLNDVAKTNDLDVYTILAKQIEDPVLGTVRLRLQKGILTEAKSPEIQQSKGLLRYCPEFDRLLIEEDGHLLCYNEPPDKWEY